MPKNINKFVIYSPNESALTGKGFWNIKNGWGVIDNATRYSEQIKETQKLPISTGNDARYVLLEEANACYG